MSGEKSTTLGRGGIGDQAPIAEKLAQIWRILVEKAWSEEIRNRMQNIEIYRRGK